MFYEVLKFDFALQEKKNEGVKLKKIKFVTN